MWIIAFFIILLTICILKDTHVEEYHRCHEKVRLINEGDVEIPKGVMLIIILLGLIPMVNIILFMIFIAHYAAHSLWHLDKYSDYIYVLSLKGNNIITRCLLRVKKLFM